MLQLPHQQNTEVARRDLRPSLLCFSTQHRTSMVNMLQRSRCCSALQHHSLPATSLPPDPPLTSSPTYCCTLSTYSRLLILQIKTFCSCVFHRAGGELSRTVQYTLPAAPLLQVRQVWFRTTAGGIVINNPTNGCVPSTATTRSARRSLHACHLQQRASPMTIAAAAN